MYLIEKIQLDYLENEINSAVYYIPYKYVLSKFIAKWICNRSRVYTHDDCWAIYSPQRELKYTKIKHYFI